MPQEQRLSHVAVTVPRDRLAEPVRGELLSFYLEVFGWSENEGMSVEGERIFLRAPSDRQYLTIRASDTPMRTSGYEHLGFTVTTLESLQSLHGRARAYAQRDDRVELSDVETAYGGRLHTFRVRYRLPLTIEVQFLEEEPGPEGA